MTQTQTTARPKPRRFAWLRPPEAGPGGAMSLWEHLRELRYRITVSVFAVIIGSIASIFFYRHLVNIVMAPWNRARAVLEETRGADLVIANIGVTSSFTFAVVVCVLGGVVLATPVWTYQVWAFAAPALLAKEKRYALAFVGVSVPLFLAGCTLGYLVWPKGIEVLLNFTPADLGITNLQDMTSFLKMEIQIILVFGLSFLLPVVVIALNMVGVLRGYQLKKARKGIIFGSFVLAAVATPTTDPFSMLMLAVPVSGMFMLAEAICRVWDKRRGISEKAVAEFDIDLNDGK